MDNILIVDDHPENIQLIARILETSFPTFRLFQATRAATALELCENITFDLIISDWDMPGMTGIDLIRKVKSDPKSRHIPVVIVTAIMLTAKDLELALETGAHDYIRNPVDPLELIARVNAALKITQYHLKELRAKDLQLMEKTMIHVRNNEFDISLTNDLEKLTAQCREDCEHKLLLQKINERLEQKIREDSWKSFEVSFQNIHPDFNKQLLIRYPGLTKGELRLCILLKLGMNTKDIAAMLYLSPESLKVSRSRLRTKLGMQECDHFHSFLAAF